MGRRTPVLAVSRRGCTHYRSLAEAAEDAGVRKVDIFRAIRRDLPLKGVHYEYDLTGEDIDRTEGGDGG